MSDKVDLEKTKQEYQGLCARLGELSYRQKLLAQEIGQIEQSIFNIDKSFPTLQKIAELESELSPKRQVASGELQEPKSV